MALLHCKAGLVARMWPAFASGMVAALGSLTIGYAMGYSSSALIDLAALPGDYAFGKGSTASDLFAALLAIGAVLGAPLGGIVADHSGRKIALLVSGVPNLIGWILIVLSHFSTSPASLKGLILTGRFLSGFAVGWLGAAVPLYTSEISLKRLRGLFGAFYQLSITIGVFLSYIMGVIPTFNYIHSAVVISVIIVIFMTLTVTLYESPRWLVSKGHHSHAEKALCWLRKCPEKAKTEVEATIQLIESVPKLSLKLKLLEFKKKHVYKPLILSVTLIFFHQFSGINVIIFYAAIIFQKAGINDARETALYAVGLLQIVATAISSGLVDVTGRKVLLVLGSIGMAISSASLGMHFFFTRASLCIGENITNATDYLDAGLSRCNPQLAPLAIISLMAFGFIFSVGWRALPFIVMSELFPLQLRGLLGGIGMCSLWFYAGIVTGFYQDYEATVQPYTAWWSFALISFIGAFYVLIFIPETKGKSLEEIEMHFRREDKCTCTKDVTTDRRLIGYQIGRRLSIGNEKLIGSETDRRLSIGRETAV